jgi:hypothetical protein
MKNIDKIIELFPDEEFMIADGFDEAIIGFEAQKMRVVYSCDKCIDILTKELGNSNDALEYFNYNVIGSYVGEKTPIFIWQPCN